MIAVQEFTEGLKTSKKQPESVATIIKREVAMEESQMKVSLNIAPDKQSYPHNIFLIFSPQNTYVVVLVRSALWRHF